MTDKDKIKILEYKVDDLYKLIDSLLKNQKGIVRNQKKVSQIIDNIMGGRK